MFYQFLESLKRPDNKNLIEAIQRGYKTIFESPVAEVIIDKEIEFIDFHIEDYLNEYGAEKTLHYIQSLIKKLKNNETVEVDKKFIRNIEISKLDNPKNNFIREKDFIEMLKTLKRFEIALKKQLTETK